MLNLSQIQNLPQIETTRNRELVWEVEHWQRCYAEAGAQCEAAWRMYNAAIDNEDPREQINALFEIATMFEANKSAAWFAWQNAKMNLLALMN